MVMSGRSVNLTTLFLGRLRPPKRLISAPCTYYRQSLTTVLHESAEVERKVCGRTEYRTWDFQLLSQTRYRLRYGRPGNWSSGMQIFSFSIPAAFSILVMFLLDLAFYTLRLFELVTFITDEPGISPVYCQTGRFANKAQINDILLFFSRFYNSNTYTGSSIALKKNKQKKNNTKKHNNNTLAILEAKKSVVGHNFNSWYSDSELSKIVFLSVTNRITTIRLKR